MTLTPNKEFAAAQAQKTQIKTKAFSLKGIPEKDWDPLVADIKERHGIGRGNVVGHSDVAPARKEDPGELFPWDALAKRRLALPSPTRDLIDPYWTDAGFLLALERFGYDVTDQQKAVIAFQRRFRPDLIDGIIDGECRAKLLALLLPRPQ